MLRVLVYIGLRRKDPLYSVKTKMEIKRTTKMHYCWETDVLIKATIKVDVKCVGLWSTARRRVFDPHWCVWSARWCVQKVSWRWCMV